MFRPLRALGSPPMRFALAIHGSRGDVEPVAAVGQELQRRGHDVRMAVPPNLVGLVESVGLAAVEYGPDSRDLIDDDFVRNYWKMQPLSFVRAFEEYVSRGWPEMSATLKSQADGADLVLTGTIYQGVAANVAEYYDIPLAALHYFPSRANGHLVPVVPAPLVRSAISGVWWWYWRMTKNADDAQRRELGLPQAIGSLSRRLTERGTLEIQAYDELCFPGLATEWHGRWPFVGALTLQLPTAADQDVESWISCGKPPIYFGFGSMPVRSAADTVAMISAACAEVGERALICSGWADYGHIPQSHDVKVVRSVNHSAVFPLCRAVVHHGGAGTTAAGSASRGAHVDPLGHVGSTDLGGAGREVESRYWAPLFRCHEEVAGYGLELYPRPAICHPSPRDCESDDHTGGQRCRRRRSSRVCPHETCW